MSRCGTARFKGKCQTSCKGVRGDGGEGRGGEGERGRGGEGERGRGGEGEREGRTSLRTG